MASFRASNILIFGGTGFIGRYITSALLRATPKFNSVTLFTSEATASSPEKATQLEKWRARGLRITTGDINSNADIEAAYKGIDTVISAVGRDALKHQVDLIRLAEASGSVKWFLPSEFGTDIEYGPKSASERIHQLKLKTRKFAREEVRDLKVTYIVTGPYFEGWTGPVRGYEEAGFIDAAAHKATVINEGNGRVGFCTMVDVGKFTVAALQHPEASFGKALRVQSFVVSPNDVIAEFEKQTGEKFAVSHTSLDQLREIESKAWADGFKAATNLTVRRIWAEGYTLYDKNDNELIGMGAKEVETLPEAVRNLLRGGEEDL